MKLIKSLSMVFTSAIILVSACNGPVTGAFHELQDFTLVLDSATVNIPEELPNGNWKGLLVVKFDSDCHLCHDKVESMLREEKMLQNFYIILVSSEPFERIHEFDRLYGLSDRENYLVGQMEEESFFGEFGAVGAPFTVVYDHMGAEVYRFDGNPSIIPVLSSYFDLE